MYTDLKVTRKLFVMIELRHKDFIIPNTRITLFFLAFKNSELSQKYFIRWEVGKITENLLTMFMFITPSIYSHFYFPFQTPKC